MRSQDILMSYHFIKIAQNRYVTSSEEKVQRIFAKSSLTSHSRERRFISYRDAKLIYHISFLSTYCFFRVLLRLCRLFSGKADQAMPICWNCSCMNGKADYFTTSFQLFGKSAGPLPARTARNQFFKVLAAPADPLTRKPACRLPAPCGLHGLELWRIPWSPRHSRLLAKSLRLASTFASSLNVPIPAAQGGGAIPDIIFRRNMSISLTPKSRQLFGEVGELRRLTQEGGRNATFHHV